MLVFQKIRNWYTSLFSGCEPILCHGSAVIAGVVAGTEFAGTYFSSVMGYCLTSAAAFGVIEIAFFLLQRILRCLLGHGLGWLMALVSSAAAVSFAVKDGAGEGWTWRIYLAAAVIVSAVWILTASLWSIFRRGLRWVTALSGLASAAVTGAVLLFFCTGGFADDTIHHYLALTDHDEKAVSALESSLAYGPHEVSVLDYGPGMSLAPAAVNLTSYMSRGDGLTEMYVDTYMDYDLSEVPMRGRVWYPAGEQNCPVLLIAHGNHVITTDSYLGYEYLGKYLASHGYVVVSVDQNACNMLSGENDARAVLLLEHIGLILDYNRDRNNPLYGCIDENSIAIAGHSRGGEMVATAYLFNSYDHYPENGVIHFDYNYNIKSLIAIAPTVNQYKPADHSVKIEDVNYLLLHGAADRDVTNFMGMSQYENISFSGEGEYIKSALYIAGANHGQFNSLWGEYDCSGPGASLLNTNSLLSQEEQQMLACVFIKVYLDVTLRGDTTCRTLLTDWEHYAAQLPETVYVQCHEESDFAAIADFEEDSEMSTATLNGVKLYAYGVNWWTEDLMDFAGKSAYDTHALRLRWKGSASYTMMLPQMDLTGSAVTFDICDLDSDAVEEGDYDLVDATVSIRDEDGNTATAQLSDFATVYPILSVKTDKLDFVFDTPSDKEAFATVSIPAEAFQISDDEIDLSEICEIKFSFAEDGHIALDNIGLTPV